jgi:Domain of unknown function (DUF4381)
MKRALLLVALWFLPSIARAQAPADTLVVPAHLSKLEAEIGERVHVRLAVPKPASDVRLIGPMPREFGTIQVLTSKESPAQGDSTAWEMDVAAFDLGEQDLRALPFRLESGEKSVPVALDDVRIQINATLPDTATTAGLRDVKPPLPVPIRWRWGRMAMALGFLLALIALMVWLRRRRGTEEIPLVEMPAVSPEDAALGALRELEDEALAARGRRAEHYVRLSGILREYVEKRFHVPAVESTTTELRQAFLRAARTPADSDTLLDLLDGSDLVKFARYDPGVDAARADLERARAWIERNRPAELPLPLEAVHAAG